MSRKFLSHSPKLLLSYYARVWLEGISAIAKPRTPRFGLGHQMGKMMRRTIATSAVVSTIGAAGGLPRVAFVSGCTGASDGCLRATDREEW